MDDETQAVLHYHPSQNKSPEGGNTMQHSFQNNYPTHVTSSFSINTPLKPTNTHLSNMSYFFPDSAHAQLMTSFHDEDEDDVKRPMNSFLLWAKIMRKKYASENPNMHNAEISKLLGKIWNSMTTKDKRPYVEQAEKLRVMHMRTYPNYRYAPKRRKERRSHRMISPEVAAALHNTLFDVNNIVSEQLSQNHILAQNLKSYGFLRNAFKQKSDNKHNNNNNELSKDEFLHDTIRHNISPVSSCSSQSPDPPLNSEYSPPVMSSTSSRRVVKDVVPTESLTLHYRPLAQENTISRLDTNDVKTINQASHQQPFNEPNILRADENAEDATGSEEPRTSGIDEEFSNYLKHMTSSLHNCHNQHEYAKLDDPFFWSDIGDIIANGSL